MAVQRLHIELGVAGFLALEPQRVAVGEEAEAVVVPVDPGRVMQAVLGHQAVLREVDAGDPAVLVVDGTQHHRGLRAVVAPGHGGRPAVGDAHAAGLRRVESPGFGIMAVLAQLRLAAGAQAGQRVVVNCGQGVQGQRKLFVRGQVKQHQ
jgi:hypothetical protein